MTGGENILAPKVCFVSRSAGPNGNRGVNSQQALQPPNAKGSDDRRRTADASPRSLPMTPVRNIIIRITSRRRRRRKKENEVWSQLEIFCKIKPPSTQSTVGQLSSNCLCCHRRVKGKYLMTGVESKIPSRPRREGRRDPTDATVFLVFMPPNTCPYPYPYPYCTKPWRNPKWHLTAVLFFVLFSFLRSTTLQNGTSS